MNASSFWPALALLLVLASLPLALRLARHRGWVKLPTNLQVATIRSITHVGPSQRLLTVEVKDGAHHRMLLLGVTHQAIHVLDQWPATSDTPVTPQFRLPEGEGTAP